MTALIVKTTLTLALALITVRLARRGRAATRHLLLTSAFVVAAALPFAAAVNPVRVEVGQVSAAVEEYFAESNFVVGRETWSRSPFLGDAGASQRSGIAWTELLIAVWIAGALLFAVPLVVGIVQASRLRRGALPWCQGQLIVNALIQEAGWSSNSD
jgi:hypothetical protein